MYACIPSSQTLNFSPSVFLHKGAWALRRAVTTQLNSRNAPKSPALAPNKLSGKTKGLCITIWAKGPILEAYIDVTGQELKLDGRTTPL